MSESRLILVDGSGYIFRAYYALPPMNNSKGIPTNAVYGFCNMMLRLIDEHPNDKILIILDAGKNTFRNTLYSEYKANRSEAPEDLIPQFGIIREAIDAFGLDVIEKKDFEADDVIASYVKYGEDNKIPTTVFSSDKEVPGRLTRQRLPGRLTRQRLPGRLTSHRFRGFRFSFRKNINFLS